MSQRIKLSLEEYQKVLSDTKAYILDQFNEGDGSTWLEGWIHGFTDRIHTPYEPLREPLMEYLQYLKGRI